MEINLKNAIFEIDELQDAIISHYLQLDPHFKKAFYTDYTNLFFNYLKKKAKLKEPVSISIMGPVRGGKSYSAITICAYILKEWGHSISINNITANEYDYIRTLQKNNVRIGDCFVIDESKLTVFGIGSIAKKMKVTDIQNIIAKKAISSIWLRPDRFSYENAQYGLRAFGKASNVFPKLVRFMLYNLQDSKEGLPLGMVYVPIFTDVDFIKNAKELQKQYEMKKDAWIEKEQLGEGDVLYEEKKNLAVTFANDNVFRSLKTKDKRTTYVRFKLGAEWTISDTKEIAEMATMLVKGELNKEDL